MFFEVFFIGILAAVSPGPDFFIVMKNSLSFGRRIGISTALGVALALFIHVIYSRYLFTLFIHVIYSRYLFTLLIQF
jgi:threonine/homoserine/homoserine lactone efflux protein